MIAYSYLDDATGDEVFQVCRVGNGPHKRIWQRHRRDGRWVKQKPEGADGFLYNGIEVLDAVFRQDPEIAICEGEKDCDTLGVFEGVTVTTNHGGAGKITPDQALYFLGYENSVLIFVDNDAPGMWAAIHWHDLLTRYAFLAPEQIEFRLPAEGCNDVTEHYTGRPADKYGDGARPGYGLADFRPTSYTALTVRAREASREPGGKEDGDRWRYPESDPDNLAVLEEIAEKGWRNLAHTEDEEANSWVPLDLADAVEGKRSAPKPDVGLPLHGRSLFYAGRTHAVSGEPESMKTWLLLASATEELLAGNTVLYVDFEDDEAAVVERLVALGAQTDMILSSFLYIRPEEPITKGRLAGLLAVVEQREPTLAVLDGVTEGMVLHGLNPDVNEDAAKWLLKLPRPLADAGPAVVQIDHVVKEQEGKGKRRYAIGGQHKLAGISGVNYMLDVKSPLSRGGHGIALLRVTKDRPGWIREVCSGKDHGVAGEFHIDASNEDAYTACVVALEDEVAEGEISSRPDELMEKLCEAVKHNPGLAKRNATGLVPGNKPKKELALDLLINEGYLEVRQGARNAQHIYFVNPYVARKFTLISSSPSPASPTVPVASPGDG